MKYLTFTAPGETVSRLGALVGKGLVLDLTTIDGQPDTMLELLRAGPEAWEAARSLIASLDPSDSAYPLWRLDELNLLPPLLRPTTLRDFYAFEEHVLTANRNRGREVPKEWYDFPVFYFSNPHAVYGHGQQVPIPAYTQALDFELEVAAVIGIEGRDIPAERAMDYVFGFTIFNDWSARDVQRQEMKVGLGPAKGKDFASSLGPYLVTPDELVDRDAGRPGVFDLEMTACINGRETSRGNWKTLHYSFGEMIARASQEVTLCPGDVIGSGTVGTGCLLELTKGQGPWLRKGDVVELEVERLGVLVNEVV